MNLPLHESGVTSGLLSGLTFGYVLENAGFASPKKLTAQLRLSDWSVFKVMFTAIIVAAIGLYGASENGLLRANGVFVPTTFFWATLSGGMLIGAGMAVGGYCPGTSVAGLASGRLDGLFFMIGMVLGTGIFAAVFRPIEHFYNAAASRRAETLSTWLHLPGWGVLGILIIIAIAGFIIGSWFERAHGGPLTAEQVAFDPVAPGKDVHAA